MASFNRPNLIYRVHQRQQPLQQVLAIIKKYEGESGIVYCASRKGTEQLAGRLAENGVKAAAYHAGMDAKKRARIATVSYDLGGGADLPPCTVPLEALPA